MFRETFCFILFWASLHEAISLADVQRGHRRSVTCPILSDAVKLGCVTKASASIPNPTLTDELAFFKTCVVDYFCFIKSAMKDEWTTVPTFYNLISTPYFTQVAKRAELFFVRNNDWSALTTNPTLRNSAGECTNLLYVIAARQLYATYVLNYVKGNREFGPCQIDPATQKIKVEANRVCYPVHSGPVTCTTDHDIALVGERSGTHASLFSMFFKETVSVDANIPGFGKSSEDLLNTNIYAFSLEYAMPQLYTGLSTQFINEVNHLNTAHTFQIEEVVHALYKMKLYHSGFYNDLHTDHQELRSIDTKHGLFALFSFWDTQIKNLGQDLKNIFVSQTYLSEVNFQSQNKIAYEIILGVLNTKGLTGYTAKAMSETGIAVLYRTDTYHTRGAVRHVVGWTQMKSTAVVATIQTTDYWVSMLENWADCVKEYDRECKRDNLVTSQCLPKLSKFMWRMLDAMFALHGKLPTDLNSGLLVVDNTDNSGLRSIVSHWYLDVKKAGLYKIVNGDTIANLTPGTTTVSYFLQAFGCSSQDWEKKFTMSCMNKINAKVREYNRALFTNMANLDKKT